MNNVRQDMKICVCVQIFGGGGGAGGVHYTQFMLIKINWLSLSND